MATSDWMLQGKLEEIENDADNEDTEAEKLAREKLVEMSAKYDELLRVNREIDQEYAYQEHVLKEDLIRIRAELSQCRVNNTSDRNKAGTFRYYNVGKPYFKDKNLNSPPDNEDTHIMKKYQMHDFSNVMTVSGWTVGDKNRLQAVILDMAKDIIRKQIHSQIAELERNTHKIPNVKRQISELKIELLELATKKLDNFNMPDSQEFDWEDIASRLNKRHSAQEYKCIWELFFNPNVNKSQWSQREHQLLQKIAKERNMQDWESIASALNTGRTGYQSFVYYRTNVNHAASGQKWTKQEMNDLWKYINLYRENGYIPWGKVASAVQNRTKIQCYNKYIRMVEMRKGRFLPEEDAVILNFVKTYGPDYRKMATFLTGRSAVQLRCRYNLLQKMRVSTTWTIEDDKKLLQIMAVQDSRMNFSMATKHFLGKDRQNIRSRYLTLMRWMKSHPNSDISCAPRRGARRLLHGEVTPNLVKALDNLKTRMRIESENPQAPKASTRPAKNKVSRESSDSVITDAVLIQVANLEAKVQFNTFVSRVAAQKPSASAVCRQRAHEISSKPSGKRNLINLQQVLFLLNVVIANKNRFYESLVGQQFRLMEDSVKSTSIVKVKSYSKMKSVSDNVELDVKPDLFGTVAGRRRFLIPPNFATVTGSRVLMGLLGTAYNSRDKNETNLRALMRRNYYVYENIRKLRERFIDLFTWPYILSNEEPQKHDYYAKNTRNEEINPNPSGVKRKVSLPDAPEVTISSRQPKRLRLQGVQTSIDTEATNPDDSKIRNIDKNCAKFVGDIDNTDSA